MGLGFKVFLRVVSRSIGTFFHGCFRCAFRRGHTKSVKIWEISGWGCGRCWAEAEGKRGQLLDLFG